MNIYDQLARDEGGLQNRLYYVNGIPHIGVGHNLRDVPISDAAATVIFKDDVSSVVRELERRLPWVSTLSEPRYWALVNLAFNMGVPGLIKNNPKMLAALQAGECVQAATELLDGPYKDQVGERAHRVATQIREDRWV